MESREKSIVKVTLLGTIVNLFLTVIKLVSGVVGQSAAMVADGIHSLSDLISDGIVLCFVRISSKKNDRSHRYGHGKFETLATLFVSVILLIVAVKLMTSGITSVCQILGGAETSHPSWIAFAVAIISIIFKEFLYQITWRTGRKEGSPVVMANAWHHRTDAFSSIASAIGIGGAILLGEKWTLLDPLVGCAISIFIIVVAVKMALPALSELLEASLPEEEEKKITQIIKSVEGVEDVHELKTRRNGPHVIIDVHVVMDPQITLVCAHDITIQVEEALRKNYGQLTQISIHAEPSTDAL